MPPAGQGSVLPPSSRSRSITRNASIFLKWVITRLGISVERTRLIMVMAAVGLTVIATAAAGLIAFIALAGSQLARRLTRSSGVPLVLGALMETVLPLAAKLVSQRLPLDVGLHIGQTTSALGGAYLLWLLTTSRRI